jgi:hypothetical protein
LPDDYQEVYLFAVTDPDKLLWLNILSIGLIAPFLILTLVWSDVIARLRGTVTESASQIPALILWLGVISVLFLHEYIHGIAIRWTGLHPRYGAVWRYIGKIPVPIAFYATPETGYFQSRAFIVVALAPVIVITLLGMALMAILPDYFKTYLITAIIINGVGAVGDLWMTIVVLRYPASVLVQDQADSIRIYQPLARANTEQKVE